MQPYLRSIALTLLGVFVVAAPSASAQTVGEIMSTGTIRVGVNSAAPPFSILDT